MALKKFKNLFEFLNNNHTEQDCINYFEEVRWNGKPTSPYDPTSKVYKLTDGKYKCKNTNKRFTVITKSIFSSTKLPMKKLLKAVRIFITHKKGISSYQLAEELDITQTTAWYLNHRLRCASNLSMFKTMLKGSVEVDETFVGGKNKNRHLDKKVPHSQGRSWKDKTPVLVIKKRKGNVIARVVPNTKLKTLEPIIKENVKLGSNVYTDEWYRKSGLSKSFDHQWVNHRKKQYVNGEVSNNSAENFNSCLKRGIYTYHWISKKHTQKYVDEFVFRSNTRKCSKYEKCDLLLSSTVGKHLTYRELVSSPY